MRLALEVLEVLLELGQLKGVPPNVKLSCEPWGHVNHQDGDCECLSSDRTGAYVLELTLATSLRDLISARGVPPDAASASLGIIARIIQKIAELHTQ